MKKSNNMLMKERALINNYAGFEKFNYRRLFINLLIMSLLLIILVTPHVYAIGIVPGRTTINYQPGLVSDVKFSIMNNEAKNMKVELSVQGELAGYVTLPVSNVGFNANEESKDLSYNVKFPDNLSPGLHIAEIIALEVPNDKSQETHIGATVAVVSQLYVYVPCPGKCIEADFNIVDAEQNTTAKIVIPVVNRGKTGIEQASAMVDIYQGDKKIKTLETGKNPVPAGARTELIASWNVDIPNGEYTAKVSVNYDSEIKVFEKSFMVGKESLAIERILVNSFRLGEIAELRVLVENRLNSEMKNVFANLLVYNSENQIASDSKSASEDIVALTKKELIIYWNTVGISEGQYNGKLLVKYGEKSTDRQLILRISQNSLDITGVGFAINSGGTGTSITTIVIVMVIILVISNLAWFVFFRKFLAKRREKNRENVKTDIKSGKGGVIRVK